MTIPETSNGRLKKEYATCRKARLAAVAFYYVLLAALFIYLCKLFVDGHSLVPSSIVVFVKEVAAVAGIWYFFHTCETEGGLLRRVDRWRCSLLNRMRREEAIDILRDGGRYFIDDCEMTLRNGVLVPKNPHQSMPPERKS